MKKLYLLAGLLLSMHQLFGQACTTTISTFPHAENFEANNGGWTSGGTNNSWAWGIPTNSVINTAASGTKAWITGLAGSYNNSENSQVTSPCYNFTTLSRPIIEMKIWWQSEFSYDGAVLQSSVNNGSTWQVVGALNDPNNWYNDNTISGNPGGQQTGWSGRNTANGSGGWVTAKHELTGLGGQTSVRFRIAFGSDGSVTDNGFAFDDVNIYDSPANDVGITAITAPVSGCGLGSQETVTVTISNFGSAAQTSVPLSYRLNSGALVNETFTGNIAPGGTANYSFTTKANLAGTGAYTIVAKTALTTDNLTGNDSTVKSVTSVPSISTFPYSENFETNNGGWTSSGTNNSWAWGTPAKPVINAAASGTKAWITGLTGDYNNSENSRVVSPCFNFSTLALPIIEFKIWWNSENSYDGAVLQSSIDGGATWQNVGAFNDPNNWYNDDNISGNPGGQQIGWTGRGTANGSGGWVTAKHELTGLGNRSSVILRIAFGSDGSVVDDGFAFDDVNIYDSPANDLGVTAIISPVSGCGLTNQEQIRVRVNNFGSATQTTIPVAYQINNGTPVTQNFTINLAPGRDTTVTFTTTANMGTSGAYNVRAYTSLATDAIHSNDTLAKTVTAIPSVATFPYFQDFENGAAGWTTGGTNNSWALGTPSKSVINSAASGSNAWVTGLSNDYNTSENSYVLSPCFNMSSLGAPILEMKVFWETEFSYDGAALQYSLDGGTTWVTIGAMGDPNNWYTDNSISGLNFAGTQSGWSGRNSSGSNPGSGQWLTASHDITNLGNQSSVIFRVAFGADGSAQDDGFAFDDFRIYDRPANDISLSAIVQPFSGCGLTTQERIAVELKNFGSRTQSGFPLSLTYTRPTGPPITLNAIYNDSIRPGETKFHIFTNNADLSANGLYFFSAYVSLPNDQDRSNDTVNNYEVSNILVNQYPYLQDFESNRGGWESGGANNSWAFGTPAKAVIRGAASGSNAWVTGGLSGGKHNNNERSYVLGPCFNFSSLTNPVIQMKIWWNSEKNKDGAVIQSSYDRVNWTTIGQVNAPTNWYNSTNIDGSPGGQSRGWSGRNSTANGSGGWVLAQQDLTGLAGAPLVYLRVAFGADNTTNDDGFAFDDVAVFNKPAADIAVVSMPPIQQNCGMSSTETIKLLVQNLGSGPVSNITGTYQINGGTVISQTFPQTIQPNMTDTLIFTQRANLSASGNYQFNFTVAHPQDQLQFNNTLSTTVFNSLFDVLPVTLDFESGTNSLSALSTTKRTYSSVFITGAPGNGSNYALVLDGGNPPAWTDPVGAVNPWTSNPETFAAAYMCVKTTGTTTLHLTFDMRQLHKGIFSNTNFRITVNGVQVGPTYTPPVGGPSTPWRNIQVNLSPYISAANPVMRIGFESSAREPYQGGSGNGTLIDNIFLDRTVGLQENLASQVVVFPNPSKGLFTVKLDEAKTKAASLEVTDITGKVIRTETLKAGETEKQLDLTNFATGIYLLKVISDDELTIRKLIVE